MAQGSIVAITGAVEGDLDEAVLARVVEYAGLVLGPVYGKNGKRSLHERIRSYNYAARISPWCVLADLDQDARCPAHVRDAWLPSPAPLMRLRFVVREIEAWLFGDPERLAAFLRVPAAQVPRNPEGVPDPKQAMVALARRSQRREIREDMAPRPGSGRTVGPGYKSRLIEFASDPDRGWRPGVAAQAADSLRRCIERLRALSNG